MAVYTDISDDDLAHFLSRYDVGDLLSFKGIAEGVENTNYMIHTEKGQFILTLYEKRVKREDLPFFLDLMDHMSHAGISCPVTERDRQGQKLLELSGKPAALITFLEGLWVRRPQPHHCTALGKALGDFHLAGSHFGGARKNSMSVAEWHQLVKKIGRDADSICAGLADLIAEELDFLEQNWPSQQNTEKSAPLLPEGIIHADLFPDNVFFLDGKISGLIDFYFACNDILAYDLAICLNAWCFETDHAFNITKARALLGGYVGVRKISKEEFEALPLLARGAALRFLLTRIHDWLHPADGAFVQPKDPREYIRKLGFHQSIKSACEYGLALF